MARPHSPARIPAGKLASMVRPGLLAAFMLAVVASASPAVAEPDDTREREHLAAIVRQIDMVDRLARQSSAARPSHRSRYYFDYRRFDADIRRISAGIADYLNPPRAQPRDPAALDGQYRREAATEAGK